MFTRRKSLLEIDRILHNPIKYKQGNLFLFYNIGHLYCPTIQAQIT